METRAFGRTDMRVGVLGFGGAEIGYEGASLKTVRRVLDEALDHGLNVVDTAECYDDSEEKLGVALEGRRDELYLFTKCGHPDGRWPGDWRPASLLATVERSLRRLRTDRVDLLQLHSCSEEELRKGDAIEALQRAREKGWTRYVGYSGDADAARYAVECGAFDSLQISVSVVDQESIAGAVPRAQESGMGVIAKRPLGNAPWRYARAPQNAYHQTYWERWRALACSFGEDPAAFALRFTLSVPGVSTLIVGTKRPGRWRENLDIVARGPLPSREFDAVRARWQEVAGPDWVGDV